MRPAVTIIGWLSVGAFGGWLAWWVVTLSDDTLNVSLTITLGTLLLIAWVMGTLLIWGRSWFAAVSFGCAAALPLTPEHALPEPPLLVAVSAALAIWSFLISAGSWFARHKRGLTASGDPQTTGLDSPAQVNTCVICRAPTDTTMCAACAAALGPQAKNWLADNG